MARPSPFLIRFFALSFLLPALLAVVGWMYFDEVRAKSFYYRLEANHLVQHLDGGQLDWKGEVLELRLDTRDSILRSTDFSAKQVTGAHFDLYRASGEAIATQLPFDSLAPHLKRVSRVPANSSSGWAKAVGCTGAPQPHLPVCWTHPVSNAWTRIGTWSRSAAGPDPGSAKTRRSGIRSERGILRVPLKPCYDPPHDESHDKKPPQAGDDTVWHKVLDDAETLPANRVMTVQAGQTEICLARFEDKLCALSNKCPHQGGPLGEGSIEKGWLRCPWHGWEFHPCSGLGPGQHGDGVPRFPVEERDGAVYVGVEPEPEHKRNVSDVVVETLVQWGVNRVFGMVGHSNLGVADAMRRAEEAGKLRYIGIRHENAGAFAA
jgi:nitrite reductase/ring-hydroxylating ferredoxin subunit